MNNEFHIQLVGGAPIGPYPYQIWIILIASILTVKSSTEYFCIENLALIQIATPVLIMFNTVVSFLGLLHC